MIQMKAKNIKKNNKYHKEKGTKLNCPSIWPSSGQSN
jgi:hypothetical protein